MSGGGTYTGVRGELRESKDMLTINACSDTSMV